MPAAVVFARALVGHMGLHRQSHGNFRLRIYIFPRN